MYGLVHQAARDMAIETLGDDVWSAILRRSGLNDMHFIGADRYGDEITQTLIHAISETACIDPESLLRDFGRHWIRFVGKGAYGSIMSQFGDSFEEFVNNLDTLHSRIQTSMPGAAMPSFELIDRAPGHLRVVYRSHRQGFEAFVEGLLHGLLERFGDTGDIHHRATDDGVVFEISRSSHAHAA